MNLEHVLSDEFVEFSTKVADVHNRKKILKEEFRKATVEFQANLANLNEEATTLVGEFETWKASVAVATTKNVPDSK